MRIDKGVYGLKQSGIIANNELQKHLKPYGMHQLGILQDCGSARRETQCLP